MTDLGVIRTATVIRPGDHVLLTIADDPGPGFLEAIDELQTRFPHITFTCVAGVSAVAVRPADA